jgi:hypothetical protein
LPADEGTGRSVREQAVLAHVSGTGLSCEVHTRIVMLPGIDGHANKMFCGMSLAPRRSAFCLTILAAVSTFFRTYGGPQQNAKAPMGYKRGRIVRLTIGILLLIGTCASRPKALSAGVQAAQGLAGVGGRPLLQWAE